MRILFTHSYFYRFDPKQWHTAQPYPPYGTLYAAAVLREAGAKVRVFDTGLEHSAQGIGPAIADFSPHCVVIYDDGFNYLTKMCLTRMREAAFEMIRIAKSAGCAVYVCSSDSSDHFGLYLRAGADAVVLGEGEPGLRDLCMKMEADPNAMLQDIAGIAYLKDGEVVRTAARPIATDLDALPDPAWDLIDLEPYRRIWLKSHPYFELNIATTRGCPYKCNWCAKPIYGNRYNVRSPQRVVAEIARLMNQYKVQDFWMADDIFGLQPRWVQAFRAEVERRQLRFRYRIQSRVDLLLKEDTIDALVASGLRQVWVGAESGAQSILDAMDKGTTVEEIHEATRLLQQKGVEVCFFLQFGYLGETKTEIKDTIRMVDTLMPHDIGISVSYPLPGTRFYDKVKDLLGEKQNWTDSDDLSTMYPATYPAPFYRRLHRYVHRRFRYRQGLLAWTKAWQGQKVAWRPIVLLAVYAPFLVFEKWHLRL